MPVLRLIKEGSVSISSKAAQQQLASARYAVVSGIVSAVSPKVSGGVVGEPVVSGTVGGEPGD